MVSFTRDDIRTLAGESAGPVLLPEDPEYAAERAAFNQTLDNRPAVVVGATGPDDVRAAVRFAGQRSLPVGVMATGHGAVRSPEGAVLISTRRMDQVTVDAADRAARAGAGVLSHQLVDAAAAYGLAPLNGSALTVGVTGYTLGGGFSPFLGRLRGWAADHVRAIELVTADGELRRVTAGQEPDLFWAVRGGKDNFGIATSLEIDLFDLPRVYGGALFYPGEHAGHVLHAFREWVATVPDEMTAAVALLRLPPLPGIPDFLAGQLAVYVRVVYAGPAAEGERLVAPLRQAAPVVADSVAEVPYAQMVRSLPAEPPGPVPFYDSSMWLRELPAQAVDALLAGAGPDADVPLVNVELRQLGGALSRPPAEPSAVAGRTAAFHLFSVGVGGPDDAAAVYASQDKLLGGLTPWEATEAAPNYLSVRDAPTARMATAFAPAALERLTAIKRSRDPANMFRVNHNLPPR
jgi:hypothetical protein